MHINKRCASQFAFSPLTALAEERRSTHKKGRASPTVGMGVSTTGESGETFPIRITSRLLSFSEQLIQPYLEGMRRTGTSVIGGAGFPTGEI